MSGDDDFYFAFIHRTLQTLRTNETNNKKNMERRSYKFALLVTRH